MQALDNQFALFILFGDYENVGNNLATLLPAFDVRSIAVALVAIGFRGGPRPGESRLPRESEEVE